MTNRTGCWHSLRFYFLGYLVLSQPELMKPECIVSIVASGMAVEMRKTSTCKIPPALLPLFPSSIHPFLASPGELWYDRGVTCPGRKPSKPGLRHVIRETLDACFLLEQNVSQQGCQCCQNKAQAHAKPGGTGWCWTLSSCNQPAPGT